MKTIQHATSILNSIFSVRYLIFTPKKDPRFCKAGICIKLPGISPGFVWISIRPYRPYQERHVHHVLLLLLAYQQSHTLLLAT